MKESGLKRLGMYFHIPFCVKKCLYCDFLSAPADEATKKGYMEALCEETAGSALKYKKYGVETIFLGGGTPSVVPVEWVEGLIAVIREHYHMEQCSEVTMEVNPGTVSPQALERYKMAGVNRLSIGLQSSHNEELAVLGRVHTWEQFMETYQAARDVGFDNINVDLMSALPGQTLSRYRETLENVVALTPSPEHISAYGLILEEGTPFYVNYEKGCLAVPDEDTDRVMYHETKRFLEKMGYHRYEISNFAREGYECRHNCGYWQREEYVGFGIGAASLIENVRFQNSSDLKHYLQEPMGCGQGFHVLNRREQMEEFMFLGLRMTEGVSLEVFQKLFGCTMESVYGDVIQKNRQEGLLEIFSGSRTDEDCVRLALTEFGIDVSNYVMAQFLLS